MLAAIRSELTRLGQPRLLVAWLGLMALFALMVNAVMLAFVGDGRALPPAAPGVAFPTRAELESTSGLMAGLAAASSMFGVVTLACWAVATASDYGSGLVRLLVASEPRRWRLVLGKAVALLLVTAGATAFAAVVNVFAVGPMAPPAGIDTSAWTSDPVFVVARAWLDLFLAMVAWGTIGLVLAVLARSAAVAIAIGIGYVLVVEPLLRMVGGLPTDWLPGSALSALASGGSAAVPFATALAVGTAVVAGGLVLAVAVFTRRDVTD